MAICDCLSTSIAPGIAFDDVRFRILRNSSAAGELADWEIAPILVERHVPGSNRSVIQYMGVGPATVTWRLRFDCAHQFAAFRAKLATMGTLTILAGMQSLVGTQITYLDRVYEQLPNTMLVGVANIARPVGGRIELDATFKRAVDPVTGKEAI